MKNEKNNNIEIKEQEDYIQNLPLKELKQIVEDQSEFYSAEQIITEEDIEPESTEFEQLEDQLMGKNLDELKLMVKDSLLNNKKLVAEEESKSVEEDDRIVNVIELLQKIEDVNRMIKIHQDDEDDFMLSQYQYRKEEFLKSLKKILLEFDISPADLAA